MSKRRLSSKELQNEVASSGLGPLQVEHFRRMSKEELRTAKDSVDRELSVLAMYPNTATKRNKVGEQERRLGYIYKMLKER
jgi:hypothetical protein